jgi:hypothetical protein
LVPARFKRKVSTLRRKFHRKLIYPGNFRGFLSSGLKLVFSKALMSASEAFFTIPREISFKQLFVIKELARSLPYHRISKNCLNHLHLLQGPLWGG